MNSAPRVFPENDRPSRWAVRLLAVSAAFTGAALALYVLTWALTR